MIKSIVVDTDILSFLFKQDTRADLYRPHIQDRLTAVSFMTLAETDRWALERNWGEARKLKLKNFLNDFIVIHSNRDLCLKWAEAIQSARRRGLPIHTSDAWVAATALLYNLPLVTHNRRHYARIDGLTVISETSR